MERQDIFRDIAERTAGDIYVGVVGGVRTGKSTFIKRLMELLVIPNIEDEYERERAVDELPQSGSGKSIMTTEPKFVPNEAVEIEVGENIPIKIRMVDCVGYKVEGAIGYDEEDGPRMVNTPWYEEAIPFQEAAEIGTRKVISEHSTIGIVMTTDGSITDIPRENYVEAEERVIAELKEINKPFLVLLNSTNPEQKETVELAQELEEQHNVPVLPVNCARLSEEDILTILEQVLYEFPVSEVNIMLPRWIEELDSEHWMKQKFEETIQEIMQKVEKVRDIDMAVEKISTHEFVDRVELSSLNMGDGSASINITAKPQLFYRVLQEESGFEIEDEHDLYHLMKELTHAKREYDKVADALREVRETGYGIVTPIMEELEMEEPELIRQGGRFGVKLKASAPSLHIIRADIKTEFTPLIGSEDQCKELVTYMLNEFEENPEKLWKSALFGKTLEEVVREGISSKLHSMPENAQKKLQETLRRIVNEGSGGLICIII